MAYGIQISVVNEDGFRDLYGRGHVRRYLHPMIYETEAYARKLASLMTDDDLRYARVVDPATGLEVVYAEDSQDDAQLPF